MPCVIAASVVLVGFGEFGDLLLAALVLACFALHEKSSRRNILQS